MVVAHAHMGSYVDLTEIAKSRSISKLHSPAYTVNLKSLHILRVTCEVCSMNSVLFVYLLCWTPYEHWN